MPNEFSVAIEGSTRLHFVKDLILTLWGNERKTKGAMKILTLFRLFARKDIFDKFVNTHWLVCFLNAPSKNIRF